MIQILYGVPGDYRFNRVFSNEDPIIPDNCVILSTGRPDSENLDYYIIEDNGDGTGSWVVNKRSGNNTSLAHIDILLT